MRFLLFGLIVAMIAGFACAEDVHDLVTKAAVRQSALVSCRMSYAIELTPALPDPPRQSQYTFSFMGPNWIERKLEGSTNGTFSGAHYEYGEVFASPEAIEPTRILHVGPPVLFSTKRHMTRPPIFAGSFWWEKQALFVKDHAADFTLTGTENVEGIATQICEMSLPTMKLVGDGFRALSKKLWEGGILRLYIAPQLGYVLPKIEYINNDKEVEQVFFAKEFTKCNELWLPAIFGTYGQDSKGAVLQVGRITFDSVTYQLVNQPIPDADFIIPLKLGTRVTDSRDPQAVLRYQVQRDCDSRIVDDKEVIKNWIPKKRPKRNPTAGYP